MAGCKYCGGKTRFLENICQDCLEKDHDETTKGTYSPIGQDRPNSPTKYGAARGISSFAEFIGWLLMAGGIVLVFIALAREVGAPGLAAGILISVSGLSLVMAAQFVRATVDNADTTREILAFLKKKD